MAVASYILKVLGWGGDRCWMACIAYQGIWILPEKPVGPKPRYLSKLPMKTVLPGPCVILTHDFMSKLIKGYGKVWIER